MKSIRISIFVAVLVATAGYIHAQNTSPPIIMQEQNTTRPNVQQQGTQGSPTTTPATPNAANQCNTWIRTGRDLYYNKDYQAALEVFNRAIRAGCRNSDLNDWKTRCEDGIKFGEIDSYRNDLARVKKDDKYGFIDRSKNLVAPMIYEEAGHFGGNISRVKRNGKWGIVNTSGTEIISCIYDEVRYFSETSCVIVTLNGKHGVINLLGNMIIPIKYDVIENPRAGIFEARLFGESTYFSGTGKEYDRRGTAYYRRLTIVGKNNKYGYVNNEGIEVIPLIYDEVKNFFESTKLALVKKDGIYLIIDESGKIRRTTNYLTADYVSDKGAWVQNDKGKYGYINPNGEEFITCQYDYAYDFRENLARVRLNNLWGFIDTQGNVVIPFRYNRANNFDRDGYAKVLLNGEEIIIDKQGNRVK